jgi:hypothetical protein
VLTKQVIASFFLWAFAMQTFNTSFVVYDYYANTSAYAKNCENKAKPQMHCLGKCQMMKKMQQKENKDQENSDRKSVAKQTILSSKSFFATAPFYKGCFVRKVYASLPSPKATNRSFEIFHPPSVV